MDKKLDNIRSALEAPQPQDLAVDVCNALQDKATLPISNMIVLSVLAGAYIAFGGLFATIALSGAQGNIAYGMAQVVAGVVFSVGLLFVIVAGAELFTGNTLMTGSLLRGDLTLAEVLRAWGVVYLGNFLGAIAVAAVVFSAGVHSQGEGSVGAAALRIAENKASLSFGAALASGIVANIFVCLAVWLAYGAKSTTDKFFGILLPIAAFVAAGLEHSVANMYLLPYGLFLKSFADATFWTMINTNADNFQSITFGGIVYNLVPVTIGNLIGGFIIAAAYWFVFLRSCK